jgi:hypothetical protein
MKGSRFSEEQIIGILRGSPPESILKEMPVKFQLTKRSVSIRL